MKEGWKEIYFKDFIKLNRGFDLPNDKIEEGDYPVVASTSTKAYHKEYKVSAPCVTTGRSGSLGTVQFVNQNSWPLNTTLYVKDFKEHDPKFVYYFLQTMNLDSFNSGAGVPTLNQNHLHFLKINIPKTTEHQQRIASILSAYDDLIEVNNERIELLEQSARELYKEWFVRMRFPNYQNAKFNKGIPEGWKEKNLDFFGKVITGKTPSTEIEDYYHGDIPFIKTPDIHNNMFIKETDLYLSEKGVKSQKKCNLPKHTICVSCIGTAGAVGITTAPVSQTNQQINSIILNNLYNLEFLYFAIIDLKEYIELFGATGATMTNLSKGKFEKLKVIYPKKEIIKKYHDIVSPTFNQIENLQEQNQQFTEIRNRLLPRLISGKLEVKA
ncbi:restriction endonuclease subunit S [Apibacter sp. HY039]|uniref:restriction endonuclease subunit S n=1 Tax=Apibacter sp. HY039 TaxID=2501476 RepID=UPI000FEC04D1|nr:restriction endonuclease subunit S [Apibacter sp. HY039]